MGNIHQFRTLLWKFGIFHWRSIKTTILKICLPLILVIAIILLDTGMKRSKPVVNTKDATIYPPFKVFNKTFLRFYKSSAKFAYIPDTQEAKKVMEDAFSIIAEKSGLANSQAPALQPFATTEDFDMYYVKKSDNGSQRHPDLVGMALLYLDPKSNKFRTTLRVRSPDVGDNFFTHDAYPTYQPEESRIEDSAYLRTGFLPLQAAINLAIMKSQDSSVNINMEMKEMPFPPHVETSEQFSSLWFFSLMVVMGLLVFTPSLVKMVVQERSIQAKEMMKMMGMSDWGYWASTFAGHFIMLGIICLIISILSFVPIGEQPYVVYCNFEIFLIFMMVFAAASTIFCLVFTTVCSKPIVAVLVIIIAWTGSYVPAFTHYTGWELSDYSMLRKLSSCFFSPTLGLHLGMKVLTVFTSYDVHLGWGYLFSIPYDPDEGLTMGAVLLTMIFSCVFYGFLIWYLDNVWPWQPVGVPRPFYFCLEGLLNLQSATSPTTSRIQLINTRFFEAEPENREQGIRLINLTKEFKKGVPSVNNASLNIYSGEITALLGHNGAGKTTTMNMITGMFAPTSGRVEINGHDVVRDQKEARRNLGLCPQHNILYEYMTVGEHLSFYASLKGQDPEETQEEMQAILSLLNLTEKKNALASQLSGGMQRKLCLGIAVIGGSKVIILDEPTAGMDPEARRGVWDMLLALRQMGDKTILLTTHYMEEADALGDRIAIMASGQIYCAGSPIFLKRMFGAGYHLRVAFKHEVERTGQNLETLKKEIALKVPKVRMETLHATEAMFLLGGQASTAQLVALFTRLEQLRKELDLSSFGVSVTTLEDVFLKVGEYVDTENRGELVETPSHLTYVSNTNLSITNKAQTTLADFSLTLHQAKALLYKRLQYSRRHLISFLFQIILPLLTIILLVHTAYLMNTLIGSFVSPPPLLFDLSPLYPASHTFYASNVSDDQLGPLYLSIMKGQSEASRIKRDIDQYLIDKGKSGLRYYRENWLLGASADALSGKSADVKAWFNGHPYHAMAMSAQFLSEALLKLFTGDSSAELRMVNHPFPPEEGVDAQTTMTLFIRVQVAIMFSLFVTIAFTFLGCSFILLPVHERASKSKLLQLMTGLRAWLFWGIHFLYDFVILLLCSLLIITAFTLMDYRHIFVKYSDTILYLILLLAMFAWSFLPITYLCSFLASRPASGFTLMAIANITSGIIFSITVRVMELMGQTSLASTLSWIFRLFPTFAVTNGFISIVLLEMRNSNCGRFSPEQLWMVCSQLSGEEKVFFECCGACYANSSCQAYVHPLSLWHAAAGRDFLMMFIVGLLAFVVLLLIESGYPAQVWTSFLRIWSRNSMAPMGAPEVDSDVAAEREFVEEIMNTANLQPHPRLLVVNMTKKFSNVLAVDHLTFSVAAREFFGLLGVNGAGKTTTFRMLTGDILPTYGTAYNDGISLHQEAKKFQSQVGYCPQFDALLDRLTGREHLALFARLRGIPESEIKQLVAYLMMDIDILQHGDKITTHYSGGTKRKLSLGMAVIGSPPLVFLDEPTAGVDPVSRRKIWQTLASFKKHAGLSFVLTSHSMEEVEALCSRVAIMVKGKFRCLGSLQRIKSKFGKGFTIVVKLQYSSALVVDSLLHNLRKNFSTVEIRDQHLGHLELNVEDPKATWKVMFEVMAEARSKHPIEDFFITDASLEQIFLSFARRQY